MLSSIYGLLAQNKEIYKNTNMSENMNYSIIKGGINNFCKTTRIILWIVRN